VALTSALCACSGSLPGAGRCSKACAPLRRPPSGAGGGSPLGEFPPRVRGGPSWWRPCREDLPAPTLEPHRPQGHGDRDAGCGVFHVRSRMGRPVAGRQDAAGACRSRSRVDAIASFQAHSMWTGGAVGASPLLSVLVPLDTLRLGAFHGTTDEASSHRTAGGYARVAGVRAAGCGPPGPARRRHHLHQFVALFPLITAGAAIGAALLSKDQFGRFQDKIAAQAPAFPTC